MIDQANIGWEGKQFAVLLCGGGSDQRHCFPRPLWGSVLMPRLRLCWQDAEGGVPEKWRMI